MVRVINAEGFENYSQTYCALRTPNSNINLFLYFYGAKNEQGASWCPDCVRAESHILKSANEHASPDSVLLMVDVGDRPTWKSAENKFRKDSFTKLTQIPTLLRYNSKARLEGDDCESPESLIKFFEESIPMENKQ